MSKLDKVFRLNPLYEADGYKINHKAMLAANTNREYWTWIPRSLKYMHPSIERIMSGGQQMVVRYLHSNFKELFFDQPIGVAKKFGKDMSKYLGLDYDASHFEALHTSGYLPIAIQALPEGIFTKPNIPHTAGINTADGYAWLGLFLETLISKISWQFPTAATIGAKFKQNSVEWIKKTDNDNLWFADYANHDFHSRGGNPFTSIAVGLAHAFSNKGSDTLNVIEAARYYYDVAGDDVCISSVNASEHSVTCTGIFYYEGLLKAGSLNDKIEEYYSFDVPADGSIEQPDYKAIAEWLNLRDWLLKFPKGILSVVADTFNLWKLIRFILPRLRKEILARDGKLVIRPDSGDPVDIICGLNSRMKKETDEDCIHDFSSREIWEEDSKYYEIVDYYSHGEYLGVRKGKELQLQEAEIKGVIELLYEIFGGDISKEGYIRLNSHIGAIYGDSINLERQVQIYSKLAEKGYAATNIVLGIGSFTYVYITRDQAGWAAKGAWFEIAEPNKKGAVTARFEGRPILITEYNIYKDPITDDGTKKSLKGFQFVYLKDGEYEVEGEVSEEKAFSEDNILKVIYKDGQFYNQVTLDQVRERLNK